MQSNITFKASLEIRSGIYDTICTNTKNNSLLRKVALICALPIDAALAATFSFVGAVESLGFAVINFLGSLLGVKYCDRDDGLKSLERFGKWSLISAFMVCATPFLSIYVLFHNLINQEPMSVFPYDDVKNEFGHQYWLFCYEPPPLSS